MNAVEEILHNEDRPPLDILNDWRNGAVSDDTMFVLIQRHLLRIRETDGRFADPEAFARMRSVARAQPVRETVEKTIVYQMLQSKIVELQATEAEREALIRHLRTMLLDKFRIGRLFVVNILKGEYGHYINYKGGREFCALIDHIRSRKHDEQPET